MNVYLHGRGLICGLGGTLQESAQVLTQGQFKPECIILPDGHSYPYFTLKKQTLDWRTRFSLLVQQAVEQSLMSNLDAPLIIASSCINIGELEETSVLSKSCLSFSETLRTCLSWRGVIYLIPVACTASSQAMLMAQNIVASGAASEVLVLGVELYSHTTISGFASMQLLSSTQSQPLGVDRDGMVLGEAVAAWHVSSVPARWQLLGGSSIVSGADVTGTSPGVVSQLCQKAMSHAQITDKQVDLIKLQASGSYQNDVNELDGVALVFEPLPALTTLKHCVGHTLGASGIVELMLLTYCLEEELTIPFNYSLDESLAPQLSSALFPAKYLLSIILGFGGEHAALVLKDNGVVHA